MNVPELAVNKFVVNELQNNQLFSDFEIQSQGTGSVAKEEQFCQSSSSREDLLLYHQTRHVHNEGVTGAVISTPSFNHDDKDDDDIIVEGSAGESQLKQLQESPPDIGKVSVMCVCDVCTDFVVLKFT